MRSSRIPKSIFMALALGLVALVPSSVLAAQSSSASVFLEVVAALDITADSALDFGRIVQSSSTQTETVLASDTSRAAAFSVTGDGNSAYEVTLPVSVNLVSISTTTTITIDSFTFDSGGSSRALTAGTDSFYVGATANIPADPEIEAYSGTFTVSVAY